MIKDECKHKWEKHTNVKVGGVPSTYLCKKCSANMTAAEVFQLETLADLQGSQKWTSRIALSVSLISLFVSILVAVFK